MNVRNVFVLALIALALCAASSQAALQKLAVRRSEIAAPIDTGSGGYGSGGPDTTAAQVQYPYIDDFGQPLAGVGLIDESGPLPILVALRPLTNRAFTINVPQIAGFLFVSRNFTESLDRDQTAVSGSSAAQIDWGAASAWLTTGALWCNSEPSSLCIFLGVSDESTARVASHSPFYDIGTWFFHGTGFTSAPFIWSRATNGYPGQNHQYVLRGVLEPDGTVPALPLAGVAALAAAVLAVAGIGLRRGRVR